MIGRSGRLLATALTLAPLAASVAAEPYGLLGRMIAKPGQRDALVAALGEATRAMPGNRAYLIARDAKNPDAIWITESWDSKAAHAGSLALPAVRVAIAKGRPLIAAMDSPVETVPIE